MAKRPKQPQTTTDRSWANRYIDDVKKGRAKRVQVRYPLSSDRRSAGNIPFEAEYLHRTYGGQVPTVGRDLDKKDPQKGALRLDEQQFQWTSSNPNRKKIGRNEIGTPTGVEELVDPPFTPGPQQGYPSDNPIEVNNNYEPTHGSAEFVVLGSLAQSEVLKQKYRYKYPIDPNKQVKNNRLNWGITADYQTPTSPQTRFPRKGAYRRKNQYTKP